MAAAAAAAAAASAPHLAAPAACLPLGLQLHFQPLSVTHGSAYPPPPVPPPPPPPPGPPPTAKEDEVTSSEEASRAFGDPDMGHGDTNMDIKRESSEGCGAAVCGSLAPGPGATGDPLSSPCGGRPRPLHPLLELPTLGAGLHPPESVYESAAKLLFLAVKWARSIPSFLQLAPRDQAILLEECWRELFVLTAAQWALPVDEAALAGGALASSGLAAAAAAAAGSTGAGSIGSRCASLLEDARRLRDLITRFSALRVDHTEFACLKALVLFKPESRGLREPGHVELLQDQTHVMLGEYCAARHPSRFGRLLLLLPAVQGAARRSLEELFFRRTVGDVSIERLLGDLARAPALTDVC